MPQKYSSVPTNTHGTNPTHVNARQGYLGTRGPEARRRRAMERAEQAASAKVSDVSSKEASTT